MAGKHVGWQGKKAQLQEGALGFAACLAERLVKWESKQASKHAGQPPAHACLCACLCRVLEMQGSRRTKPACQTAAPATPAAAKSLALNLVVVCVTQEYLHSCTHSHEPVHTRLPLLVAAVCSRTCLPVCHGCAPCVPPARSLPSPCNPFPHHPACTSAWKRAGLPACPPQHRYLSLVWAHNMAYSIFWECSPFLWQHCVLFLMYIPGVVPQVGNCSS